MDGDCEPDVGYVHIMSKSSMKYEKTYKRFERRYNLFDERSVALKPVATDGHSSDDCLPNDNLFEPTCDVFESWQTESVAKAENSVSTLIDSDPIGSHSSKQTANDDNLEATHRESDGVSVAESGSAAVGSDVLDVEMAVQKMRDASQEIGFGALHNLQHPTDRNADRIVNNSDSQVLQSPAEHESHDEDSNNIDDYNNENHVMVGVKEEIPLDANIWRAPAVEERHVRPNKRGRKSMSELGYTAEQQMERIRRQNRESQQRLRDKQRLESDGVSVAESGSAAVGNEPKPTASIFAQMNDNQSIERFIESQVFNGQRLHRCVWTDCVYVSANKSHVREHIQVRHVSAEPLECPHQDCGRTFTRLSLYRQHLKFHLCGFTVDANRYKYGFGLCSQYTIRQYMGRERLDAKVKGIHSFMYRCQWSDCGFSTVHLYSMQYHIHAHVCPFRRA